MSPASVFSTIVQFFRGQRWDANVNPERGTVSFEYAGEVGAWNTYTTAFESERQVATYGVLPFLIEPAHRTTVTELITRINFGLVVGNFEMDLRDGEVRYRTSLDFEGGELTTPLLQQLVRSNLSVMEHYLPAFIAIALRNRSAVDALATVDREPQDRAR
jgi:hypothetical protein